MRTRTIDIAGNAVSPERRGPRVLRVSTADDGRSVESE